MKHPPGPTQGLSLADFRQQQLVAACGPVWLFNKGIHLASIVRSVLAMLLHGQGLLEAVVEVATAAAFAATVALPAAATRLKRPDMIQAACVIGHAMNSVLLFVMGWGITLFPAAARGCLANRLDLVIEMVMAYQYQLRLPVMAILHAFRQAGYASIILWRMEGDHNRLLVRVLGNWTVMMLFSGFLEIRLRAAHQKACRAMQQLEQQQQGKHEQPQDKQEQQPEHPQSADDVPQKMAYAQSQLLRRTPISASDMFAGGSLAQTNASPKLVPGEAGAQLPAGPVPAAARAAPGTSVLPGVQQARLAHNQQQAAQALLQSINDQHSSSYKRRRHGKSDIVRVKVEGIELEHLPPDLPEVLQKQLSYCMPGVSMTGLALRSGCVMLTLDLARCAEEGTAALSADSMRNLITRLMQSQAMGQVLEDGTPMCIQMPDELALCRWDSARGSYTSEGAPALDSSDWYSCRMFSAGPAVHCLLDNTTHTSATSGGVPACYQLTLTVVVELPSNCQLHGWQPAGAAALAGSGGLLPDSSQDGPVVDAMLLARRLGGGYLPVVLEHVPYAGMGSGNTAALQTTVQGVVSVAGEDPAALHLELWCKQADAAGRAVEGTEIQAAWVPGHMPGLELLVSRTPLLVLPGSCKEAAAELQQHIDDIGGVQPQHALPLASSSAISPSNTIKYSTPDLSHDTSSLHGTPPAAGQPGVNTGQTASGQPMQHKHSPKGSDSASSHTPAGSHPPSDDPECDPVCCLLEDLGVLLTHQPTAGATLAAAVPDGVISQQGDDLLVYAVQHGLTSVASVIVDAMQRIEQHGASSTSARPAIVSPSGWLLRVAGCASNSDSDGLPGGKGWRMSLLHAAMASGSADMLGHVFRWGTLYGGPDWAWPWELEDATGCTALHLAAAQPAAGACAALLKTITCMLSAAQMQAARNAWLHCQGGLQSSPAQLFALASNGGCVREMWSNQTPMHDSNDASTTEPNSSTENARPEFSTSSSSGLPPATTAPTTQQRSTQAQSWLGSMMEVWTSREPQDYHAWAKRQDSLFTWYWAAALFAMSVAGLHRSAVEGCLQYEWLHITLYSWFMIPALVAMAGGHEWLGSRQVWMVLAQVFPILDWVAKSWLLHHQAPVWILAATTGADVLYVLLIGVAIDKIPMSQLVVSRAIEVLAQSHAYRTLGFPRALAVHVAALVVSTVARTRKLRAFYRWQDRQQASGHASPSDRKREDAGEKWA